jgi:hypothetical protein
MQGLLPTPVLQDRTRMRRHNPLRVHASPVRPSQQMGHAVRQRYRWMRPATRISHCLQRTSRRMRRQAT